MKKGFLKKLFQPKVIVIVVLGLLVLVGFFAMQKHNQNKPYRAANEYFKTTFANIPTLPGAIVWAEEKDDKVNPSSSFFSIEPHSGSMSRTLIKVATADIAVASKEYLSLSEYMQNDRGLSGAEVVPGKMTTFIMPSTGGDTGTADVFVINSSAELKNIPFLTLNNPALQGRLEQHFNESEQPLYGYAMRVTYILK